MSENTRFMMFVVLVAFVATMVLSGCGKAPEKIEEPVSNYETNITTWENAPIEVFEETVKEVEVEEILFEEILVEEIQVEEILIE